jgi:hypothetical protein
VTKKKYSLTEEHRAQLKPWAEKWIRNAMSTAPMTEEDRSICIGAVKRLYRAANLEPPLDRHIVFVPSPFVLRFASGFATWIWHLRNNKKADAAREATAAATHAATAAATHAATAAATAGATHAATRDATADATYAATADATYAATYAATDAATADATYAATADATHAATAGATHAATRDATADATYAATDAATAGATRAATRDATADATHAATDAATRAATDAATRAATHAATDAATADATYAATDAATDAATHAANWYVVNGDMVRCAIDLGVGLAGLICAQKSYYSMWQGGNQWSGWNSFLSFFRHVVQLDLNYAAWEAWETLSLHSGPRCVNKYFCIISDRPEVLLVDDQNRPHCADGPFCRWRDGSSLYSFHGTRVPAWVIERPNDITAKKVLAEENAEVRRVMIERMGMERFITGAKAKKIHSHEMGELFSIDLPNDPEEYLRVVRVKDPSTGRFYFLRVPPSIARADDAVAWTFGFRVGTEYQPIAES